LILDIARSWRRRKEALSSSSGQIVEGMVHTASAQEKGKSRFFSKQENCCRKELS
jgi:hypothetical protein